MGHPAVAAGVAFVAMMSSADASVAYAAPASPKIIAVETANFFTSPPSDRFEKLAKLVVHQCVAGKGFHKPFEVEGVDRGPGRFSFPVATLSNWPPRQL